MGVEKKILLNFIRKNNISNLEIDSITNLYNSYLLVCEFVDGNMKDNNKLQEYENRIYTIDGKLLTELQKVELELNRIERVLSESKNNITTDEVDKMIEEIEMLKKLQLDYASDLDKVTLDYIKKKISILQSKLGLKNNFFLATYEVFLEKYINICISENIDYDHVLESKKRI